MSDYETLGFPILVTYAIGIIAGIIIGWLLFG